MSRSSAIARAAAPAALPASGPFRMAAACAAAAVLAMAAAAAAQGMRGGYEPAAVQAEGTPKELEGVTIDASKLGASIPMDLRFKDENGRDVTLREVFPKDRPVLLQLGYMRCPMLCSLVLNELVRGLKGVDWSVGKEFHVVSVSINPEEGPALAAAKKQGYAVDYNRPGSDAGWHFLTGPAESSKALADAVGFQFRRQPDGEYAHAACIFVVTPDGRVSRQVYGVKYEPSTLRMALVEGAEGTVGSIMDRFILWCHQYDPTKGSYTPFARRLMQLGGVVTVVAITVGVAWLRIREGRAHRLQPPAGPTSHTPPTT
ncbi:MAG: SCO family protein [Phycisphaerales bacterium]